MPSLFHRLVQAPADVIVAAQIVHKPAVVRQGVEGIQLRLQQAGVPAGKAPHRLTMVDTL